MTKAEQAINDVLGVIQQYEFSLSNEKQLQALIHDTLTNEGVETEREYPLPPYGVVDLFKDGVGFEIKIQGQKKAIYRQCRDYALHDEVDAIVLITSKAMGLPQTLNDKPAYIYSLTSRRLA